MNYLIHYGVPGQKWGVRRYQNADGTYTELGKQRLRGELGKATKARAALLRDNAVFMQSVEDGKRIMQELRRSEDFSRLSEHFPSLNPNYRKLSEFKEKSKKHPIEGFTTVDYYDGDKHVAQFDIDNDNTVWGVEVDQAYRGCGLGSQLIRQAVDKYCGSSLYVFLDNEIAIHMYERNGFAFDPSEFQSKDMFGYRPIGKMRLTHGDSI